VAGGIGAARLWYEPHLDRIHEDSGTRHADLIQLEQITNGYPSRERFLTDLTLDPPNATSDQAGVPLLDEDYLILSTIHSAKGQEWKSVFVLNVVDGCIPSDLGTEQHATVTEPDMGSLHDDRHAAQQDDLVAPIELVGFPRCKDQRNVSCSRRCAALFVPLWRFASLIGTDAFAGALTRGSIGAKRGRGPSRLCHLRFSSGVQSTKDTRSRAATRPHRICSEPVSKATDNFRVINPQDFRVLT
jgi:UvrD-like helicase C-terminal domain